jgi:hypothetical protein
MPESPRTFDEALAFARAEHDRETEDWTGYCQRFVRTCYGIPSGFSSAWTQWLGADDEDRHPGGSPANAPVGSALCYKGSGPHGHIMLAARPDGDEPGAWSNDLVRAGDIDWASRTAPTTKWGQGYLGYLIAVNHYDLQLKEAKPAKPKHTKRYQGIARSIENLERALELAVELGERRDAKVIRAEIRDLRELYAELRHA